MSSTTYPSGVLELRWATDLDGTVRYQLYAVDEPEKRVLLSYTQQGPFDTALEVAQWAWRVIARQVPPASSG